MRLKSLFFPLFFISILLPSCEFHCSVGSKEEPVQKKNTPIHQDGSIIYNGIELVANKVKLNKAYLIFENGKKVPDDNFVDFKQPVTLILLIDTGWTVINNRSWIAASEKVLTERGKTLLNKENMIPESENGYLAKDAKIISLTIGLNVKPGTPPTYFTVPFRVWDKKGDGYIEGSYKLYSK